MGRQARIVNLTDSQAAVYDALRDNGPLPDHALVPIVQHVHGKHISSSGIRTRRAELVKAGLVTATGDEVVMPSGRAAKVYDVVNL